MAERDPETPALAATREQRQIRNADLAQKWTRDRFAADSGPLSVSDILMMHRMITEESDIRRNSPRELQDVRRYRRFSQLGGVHRGAPHEDVPRLMEEYVHFVDSRRMRDQHPVMRALLAHFFLVTIHPFGDGNGRVSRLVEAGILFRGGYNVHGFYGLSNYFYRNEVAYKTALQECRNRQPCRFVHPFRVAGFRRGADGHKQLHKGQNEQIGIRRHARSRMQQENGKKATHGQSKGMQPVAFFDRTDGAGRSVLRQSVAADKVFRASGVPIHKGSVRKRYDQDLLAGT